MEFTPMDRETLLLIFFSGVLSAGILGLILGRINVARNDMELPGRPMSSLGPGTPRDVMSRARRGTADCLIYTVLLLLALGATGYWLYRVVNDWAA
jgi:hypothetical protein